MDIAEKEKITKELVVEYQKSHDKSIAQELCTMYESTIQKIVWKSKSKGEHEDLVQAAYVRFMKCINMYDVKSKAYFGLYLKNSLNGEMKKFNQANWALHVDSPRLDYISHLRRAEKKLVSEGIRPTNEMVALELGVKVGKVNEELDIANLTPASLDFQIEGDEGGYMELGDKIADPHNEFSERIDHENFVEAIESLTDDEKRILHMYFYENMAVSTISKKLCGNTGKKNKVEAQIQKILGKIRAEMGIYVSLGQKKSVKLKSTKGASKIWYKKGIVDFFYVESETKKIFNSLSNEKQQRLRCLSPRQFQVYVLNKKYNVKTIAMNMHKDGTKDVYRFLSQAQQKLGERQRNETTIQDRKFFATNNDITQDEKVCEAMKYLTQEQKQVLYDVHHLHMSTKEIVEKRDMKSVKNVQNMRLAAIYKIQKILSEGKEEFCEDAREKIKKIDDDIVAKMPKKQRMYIDAIKNSMSEKEIGKKMGMSPYARSALRRRILESAEKIQEKQKAQAQNADEEAEFEKTLNDAEKEYLFQKKKELTDEQIMKILHLSQHNVQKINWTVQQKRNEYFHPVLCVLSDKEIQEGLKNAKLTERQKQIYQMIHFEGQSPSEVAKKIKTYKKYSAYEVQDTYARAEKRIREYIHKKIYRNE